MLLLLCACQAAPAEAPEPAAEPEPAAAAVPAEAPEPEEPVYLSHENFMQADGGFFRPDEVLRRAECAQLLYNLSGSVPPSEPVSYTDVAPEAWYAAAVRACGALLPAQDDPALFAPQASVTEQAFADALRAVLHPDAAAAEAKSAAQTPSEAEEPGEAPAPLTRAQAAVLIGRALGRAPDTACIAAVPHTLLLDVPEDRADYAAIVEAVTPHEYAQTSSGAEQWKTGTFDGSALQPGVYLSGGSGFLVGEDGRVLRGSGFAELNGERYARCDDTGRILADGAPHYFEGEAIYASSGGALLRACAYGECRYDDDGCYTTGSQSLDALLDAFLAEHTTSDMTQSECLRACYDAVRAFGYLGRNAAYGAEVKTIPYSKQLEFAEKIFSTGKGDCYNFTAAFCLLARRLGYLAKPVVGECAYSWNWGGIAHGWVEITIDGAVHLFDPQIENYNLRAGISNETSGAYDVTYETAHARYRKH